MRPRTILLYSEPAMPDGCHAVAAPGGYEVWQFEAVHLAGDRQVVMTAGFGLWNDREYGRGYRRYRRRPTRQAPPVPGDCGRAMVGVYEGSRQLVQQAWRLQTLSAQRGRLTVSADGLQIARQDNGAIEIISEKQGSELQLRFTPEHAAGPSDVTLVSSAMTRASHRWVVGDGVCGVKGIVNGQPFDGRGFHDQLYGTAPIGDRIARWIGGQMLIDRKAIAFQIMRGRGFEHPDEGQIVEYSETGPGARPI